MFVQPPSWVGFFYPSRSCWAEQLKTIDDFSQLQLGGGQLVKKKKKSVTLNELHQKSRRLLLFFNETHM